jgi:hypothetical protein
MEFRTNCTNCGREHIADNPEGKMSAWFLCECGEIFGLAIIIEPFGKAFLYGVEALRRKRYSSACIQFATAFEVFQKRFVEILLKKQGVEQSLARFIVYDLDLPRKNYSQVAQHILHHSGLKHPDVSIRISAVHYGRTPKRGQVLTLGNEILDAIDNWLKIAEQHTGSDYQELSRAYENGQRLPQEVSEFDRTIFGLRTSYRTMSGYWLGMSEQ